jgi:SAM-dependent methyltransferase
MQMIGSTGDISLHWKQHPLCGPLETFLQQYGGPKAFSPSVWVEFAQRLDPDEEIQLLLSTLEGCSNVLDIGGGTGLLTKAIAQQHGHCTVVEPSVENAAHMSQHRGIDIAIGKGEQLPFPRQSFDAVVATWMLQYADRPDRCIEEIVRVCSRQTGSIVTLAQAAPWNEIALLLNRCATLLENPPSHHGYLLALAATALEAEGFDIELTPFPVALRFPEETPEQRVRAATALLQQLCFDNHPRSQTIRQHLAEPLTDYLQERQFLNDDGVLLIARYP